MLVGYILFCGDIFTSNNMHEVMSGDISFVFFDMPIILKRVKNILTNRKRSCECAFVLLINIVTSIMLIHAANVQTIQTT